MDWAGMSIAGAIVLSIVGGVGALLYFLATRKGAQDVIQADNDAARKGTEAATKEVVKTVTEKDSEAELDKGTF